MKFFRNNLKLIIGFIVGVILASSITVYAYSYFASDIKYTDDKSVADALNELYSKKTGQVNVLFENGEYYNQDKIQVILTGCSIVSNQIQISTTNYGIQTKGLDNKKHIVIYTIATEHPGNMQWGTCTNTASHPSIIQEGTNRTGFNTSNIASTNNMPIMVIESTNNSGTFLGSFGGTINVSKIEYLEI